MHPFLKREVRGVMARAEINRAEFGMTRESEHDLGLWRMPSGS